MRKLLALGLAGALAMGSVAVTAASVSAEPKYGGWNNEWKKNKNWKGNNWNGNWKQHHGFHGGFWLPFVLGGAVGYGLSQGYGPYYDYEPGPSYRYSDAHVQWCFDHYPNTYNPVTNMYFVRPGVPAVCYSPFYG